MGKTIRRRPIVCMRRITLGTLDASARSELCERCHAIYRELSETLDRERFEQLFFQRDDTRIALFYGSRGELAGFSNATILRVQHEGIEHAVFSAGVYVQLAYRAGEMSAIYGLTEALRFRLRHPRTPLAYLSMASSPAPYCLFTRTMSRVYPSRHRETPPKLESLVRKVIEVRGLTPIGDSPWLVETFVKPRDLARLHVSRRLRDDPDAAFYRQQNPTFETTADAALLVWIPLDSANILTGLLRATWRRLRHRSVGLRRIGPEDRSPAELAPPQSRDVRAS